MGIKFHLIISLVSRILSRPAWLMALFLFLACLIPFAGGMSPFRGEAPHVLDPFGFSLLTPSRRAFGASEMLALAGLFLIPSALMDWRRGASELRLSACPEALRGLLPFAALFLYAFFLLLSLPLIVKSASFPGPAAVGLSILDLLLLGAAMAWIVDFALERARSERLRPLAGWIVAGGFYLARGMSDVFLMAPQAEELVEPGWTALAWHGLIALAAFTLHALPLPATKARATL